MDDGGVRTPDPHPGGKGSQGQGAQDGKTVHAERTPESRRRRWWRWYGEWEDGDDKKEQ
jgi:hypothetical protein